MIVFPMLPLDFMLNTDPYQVCKANGKGRAFFHSAMIWKSNTDLETGNYVPSGRTGNTRLPESRMYAVYPTTDKVALIR